MLDLSGLFVPLPTPFTDDASTVSEVRLSRLVRRYLDSEIGGFVLNTETGEFGSLSQSERKSILEIALRESQGRIPILTNVSSLSTARSLELAQHAKRHGARAVVMMPPFYGDFTPEELKKHYQTVAQYGGAAIVGIDPLNLLREVRVQIAQEFPVRFARSLAEAGCPSLAVRGHASSDEFALGVMMATPLAALVPAEPITSALRAQDERMDRVRETLKRYGPARVCKRWLQRGGLDLGPVRSPLLDLPDDVVLEMGELAA